MGLDGAVRQIHGGGRRGVWSEGAGEPQMFQRADGTVMSEKEIAAVVEDAPSAFKKIDGSSPARSGRGGHEPTAKQAEAWEAVNRLGSMSAAAKELGIHQTAVRDRLRGYMVAAGIDGEMPGRSRHRTPSLDGAAVRSAPDYADSIPAVEPTSDGPEPSARPPMPPAAIEPLLAWLVDRGPGWSQAEAERWFRAFTATIDLIYPTTAA